MRLNKSGNRQFKQPQVRHAGNFSRKCLTLLTKSSASSYGNLCIWSLIFTLLNTSLPWHVMRTTSLFRTSADRRSTNESAILWLSNCSTPLSAIASRTLPKKPSSFAHIPLVPDLHHAVIRHLQIYRIVFQHRFRPSVRRQQIGACLIPSARDE